MISAEFRIRLPEGVWVTDVSRAFPDATFRLLSGRRGSDTAIELGEVVTDEPDVVVAALREHPSMTNFDLLESTGRRLLGKYETTDTDLYEFVEATALAIEFPVVVQNGWFEFDLTGTREELEHLRTSLDGSGLPYELQSLVHTTGRDALLTDRQREVLETAIREGYFEVPRDCSLADLADSVGVDKSTASTVLRRGEATLIKWFLAGPDLKARHDA